MMIEILLFSAVDIIQDDRERILLAKRLEISKRASHNKRKIIVNPAFQGTVGHSGATNTTGQCGRSEYRGKIDTAPAMT